MKTPIIVGKRMEGKRMKTFPTMKTTITIEEKKSQTVVTWRRGRKKKVNTATGKQCEFYRAMLQLAFS